MFTETYGIRAHRLSSTQKTIALARGSRILHIYQESNFGGGILNAIAWEPRQIDRAGKEDTEELLLPEMSFTQLAPDCDHERRAGLGSCTKMEWRGCCGFRTPFVSTLPEFAAVHSFSDELIWFDVPKHECHSTKTVARVFWVLGCNQFVSDEKMKNYRYVGYWSSLARSRAVSLWERIL